MSVYSTYKQDPEGQNDLGQDSALLYLPGLEKPVGSISFPRGSELSGMRLCISGQMYDSPRFSDGAFHFEVAKDK